MRRRAVITARLMAVAMVLSCLGVWGWSAYAQQSEPESPHVVIAQGLAVAPETTATWRVRTLDPLPPDEAESTTYDFSFAYELTGATVIRNDITGKRARIEPGEAYFFSGGDDYTRYRYGNDPASMLLIEFVTETSETQPAGVLFESDPIDNFPSGVNDYELYRGVLPATETTSIANFRGPALFFVLQGSAIVTPEGGSATGVDPNGGLILDTGAEMTAGKDGVIYLIASFQDEVLDPDELAASGDTASGTPEAESTPVVEADSTPADEASSTPAATPSAEATAQAPLSPSADEDRDGVLNGEETRQGTDPRNPDTDGDGLKDGDELRRYKTDPLEADSDGDGLNDGDEINRSKTDPLKADSDGDGASDGDEWFIYGTDPNDPKDAP